MTETTPFDKSQNGSLQNWYLFQKMAKATIQELHNQKITIAMVTRDDITSNANPAPLLVISQLLWPSTTMNYGGPRTLIGSLWHLKCCGFRPKQTMAAKGRK